MPRRVDPAPPAEGRYVSDPADFEFSEAATVELRRIGLPDQAINRLRFAAWLYEIMLESEQTSPTPAEVEAARKLGIDADTTALFSGTKPIKAAQAELAARLAQITSEYSLPVDARRAGPYVRALAVTMEAVENVEVSADRARQVAREFLSRHLSDKG